MTTNQTNLSLAQELADFKEGFKQRAAPERVATMENATTALRETGIEQQALKAGDEAPGVSLPDALGKTVAITSLWQQGPLVVVFYRGGWCPYCNLELRAWQRQLPRLEAMGARLAAISPQTPDNSLSTAQKNELSFAVLSDSRLTAADAFGIAFAMPPELIELYRRVGHDLPVTNGNGRWALPIPATFVINTQGKIVYAHVDADYRERAEPDDVMRAVEQNLTQAVAA
jgi:peroxiredoxin